MAIGIYGRKPGDEASAEAPASERKTLAFRGREKESSNAAPATALAPKPEYHEGPQILDELEDIEPEIDDLIEHPAEALPAQPAPLEEHAAAGPAVLSNEAREIGGGDTFSGFGVGKLRPHDEEYVRRCYQRIMDLKSMPSLTKTDLIEGIHEVLEDMAELAQKKGCSYAAMVDSLLMLHWTRKKEGASTSYDEHMKEHIEAIKVLAKAWVKDKHFSGQRKLRILDASCGTGKGLEAFLEALPRKMLSRVRIVANDVSPASLKACKETLKRFDRRYGGKVHIEYTNLDITQELPKGKFDVVMLWQTLPLICDEKALRAQRLHTALPSESRHTTAKRKVLEALVRKVKPGKGEFLLVDEDPMKLSSIPDDFEGIVEDTLFREIFRPIDKMTLINVVMKKENMQPAKFLSHYETFIDTEHGMYLISSTDSSGERKRARKKKGVEDDGLTDEARKNEDERRIFRRIEEIHPVIIERLQGFDQNTDIQYRKIGTPDSRVLYIDKEYYDAHIAGKNWYWHKNGSYDMVVVSGLMHELGAEDYRSLIERIKRSKKAEAGAALLFIDEWPAPAEKTTAVRNSDARMFVMKFDDHEFCASLRSGNKYGYLYVIRDLDAPQLH